MSHLNHWLSNLRQFSYAHIKALQQVKLVKGIVLMRKFIEKLKKDKSLANQQAFFHALSKQIIYLAETPQHEQKAQTDHKLLIEYHDNGVGYLLGFSNPQYFQKWQQHEQLTRQKYCIKPFNFEELCLLMKNFQKDETALILNPACDNLIIANELFHDAKKYESHQDDTISDKQTYVAMTPLEQGDFSFELLQLLQNEFNSENWISSVWAATIDIDSMESFLLIIAGNNTQDSADHGECDQNLYQLLLKICTPFLGSANLTILSSTTSPFNRAILNYDPIFARKPG